MPLHRNDPDPADIKPATIGHKIVNNQATDRRFANPKLDVFERCLFVLDEGKLFSIDRQSASCTVVEDFTETAATAVSVSGDFVVVASSAGVQAFEHPGVIRR